MLFYINDNKMKAQIIIDNKSANAKDLCYIFQVMSWINCWVISVLRKKIRDRQDLLRGGACKEGPRLKKIFLVEASIR